MGFSSALMTGKDMNLLRKLGVVQFQGFAISEYGAENKGCRSECRICHSPVPAGCGGRFFAPLHGLKNLAGV